MAVFTPVSEDQLAAFLQTYDLGALQSCEGIAQGVSNTNFHVFTDRGRYILTLFEEWRTDVSALPFYFAYSLHLGNKGIHCPQPIANRTGDLFGPIAGKQGAILSFLEGRDIKPAEITPAICRQLGAIVAQMHRGALDFTMTRENSMGMAAWHELAAKTGRRADEVEEGLALFITEELSCLKANWPRDLPRGAVHADIFPDNVFIKDGKVDAVIDFYFSCTDLYVFDLAIVINAWCFDTSYEFRRDRFAALMEGYESVRPLSAEERAALPLVCRGAAIRVLVTRTHDLVFHDPASFVAPHPPKEYIEKLRFHQHGKLFES